MTIPTNHRWKHAYHFTLIDNLESIIENGILCTNIKNSRGISHKNVAEEGIQSRRSTMSVPCSNGKVVHDYVPFYFSKRTSMQLGVINKKNIDQQFLIYLAIPITVLESKEGVVFSDASANTDIPPNFYNSLNLEQLESLNWVAIDSKSWSGDNDAYRHQKMAELLFPERVDISDISHIIAWNESITNYIKEVFRSKGIEAPLIKFDPDHYYTKFYEPNKKNESIITGPFFLKRGVDETIAAICNDFQVNPRYPNIEAALYAINNNFSSIKEFNDIDGLQTNYGPHSDDVGTHSRRVATLLTSFSEFNNLSANDKNIVTLSAYLHDIGKGPKSRWTNEIMSKADNDHAAKSLPMLKRILTEDIGGLDAETVRKIVMLVTYDDLVGDIVANGRNEKQLFNVIKSESDLNMLVALGKADMFSINQFWVSIHQNAIDALKQRAISSLSIGETC